MGYEIDDLGVRLIGYGVPISFYDPTRTLRAQIYLQNDGTLNLGGIYGDPSDPAESTGAHALGDTATHIGAISDSQAPQFVLLDGSRPIVGDLQVNATAALRSALFVAGVSGFYIHATESEFNDVTVRGHIEAESGSIGGWTIDTGHLYAGSGSTRAGLAPATYPFYAGSETQASAPFRVTPAGALTATSATITGAITATSGTLGNLAVTGTVTVGAAAPYLQIDGSNKRIQSSSYASGISGMRIQANGDAEFNNVRVRGALTSAVFVKDLIEARAGSQLIVKSAGVLAADIAVPGSGTWNILIEDPPGGGFLFANSDICRMRSECSAGIGDIWFTVASRTDMGDGTQRYTCTYASGTRSITYPAGAPVLDYGTNGAGGLYLTADNANGPFMSVFTHAGAPWTTQTERVRLGNLNGLADYSSAAYGIFIGDYAGNKWLAYDPTNSLRIRGDAIIDGTITAAKINVSTLSAITANLGTVTAGEIRVGTGTVGTNFTGFRIYSSYIGGFNNDVLQAGIRSSDGAFVAGGGAVRLDASGISITKGSTSVNMMKWFDGATEVARIYGDKVTYPHLLLASIPAASANRAQIDLWSVSGSPYIGLYVGDMASGEGEIYLSRTMISMNQDLRLSKGLYVGSTGTDPADGWIYADGGIYINDTSNAKQTLGLTINQGSADDEILTLKSSDVAHGMTDWAETDTYGAFAKTNGNAGGLQVFGYRDADGDPGRALSLVGRLGEAADTTKSTSATAVVALFAQVKSGTTITSVGSNGNLVTIHNHSTTRFIFDAEGDAHADVQWTTFDDYDDVALLTDLERAMLAQRDPVKAEFVNFLQYNHDALEEAGIVHFDREAPGHAMVNTTKLSMALVGAIRQMNGRMDALEARMLTG